MELIAAGLGGHQGLNTAAPAVLHVVSVGLYGNLLDRICTGREIDDTGPDVAGDVQAVHHIHIAVFTVTTGTGVDEVLRSVIETSLSIEASRYTRSDAHERCRVARGKR